MQEAIESLIEGVKVKQDRYNRFGGSREDAYKLMLDFYKAKDGLESHPDYIKYMRHKRRFLVRLQKYGRRLLQSGRGVLNRFLNRGK